MFSILSREALAQRYAAWLTRKKGILAQLCGEDTALLNNHTQRMTARRGERLQIAADRVVIVDRGLVGLNRPFGGRLLGSGEIFGTLFQAGQSSTLDCHCESRLIVMETAVFREVLGHYPAFLLRMIELQEARQNSVEQALLELGRRDAFGRTARMLLALQASYGAEYGGLEAAKADSLALGLGRLAMLLGLSPGTLRRVIGEMTAAEILVRRGRVLFIRDLAELRRLAARAA